MGIANLQNPNPVAAVPGMSVKTKYRSQWPYWAKKRNKLIRLQEEMGYRSRMPCTGRPKQRILKFTNGQNTVKSLQLRRLCTMLSFTPSWTLTTFRGDLPQYADLCDLFAKHWIFGECAIATIIRFMSSVYETMDIQFYWSTQSAADCHRGKWNAMIDGFHRCRHDHKFSHLMYGSDATRDALRTNSSYLSAALALRGWIL